MDRVSRAERELVRKMQKQTNADRIRAMTDEELAVWISALYSVQYHAKASPHYWLDWLREEANNDP